ncbi:CpaF family protein [Ferrovum myxofaciens]|uniref:CpaF family protein n=2 Tax=root TaxID=1 RepID=A0A859A7B4_9PROT|nr:ATPase, T2SS/T4P/T4SS family [Ferrovum myxofaciens]NDU89104.1 CpaF family protein [Ferrovum sp.]KXW58627.1 putative conjugal transfer proteinc [Ferrovum myxofaciens]MBU6994159.1 CpaF family protein [Ferrovum myxofaciens]QKE38098.1 MAG: CpaF family protein [Ferrovum myxofaciens]QWY75819.1 MAG: CpaF family protein [Ferrovum myxofaciens]
MWNEPSYLESLLDDALGDLSRLLEEADIREVMVNAPDDVWVERAGQLEPAPLRFSAAATRTVIHVLAALSARTEGFEHTRPLLDMGFRDWRISAVLPPVAVQGPALCLRKHGGRIFPLQQFTEGVSTGSETTPPVFEIPRQPDVHGQLLHWIRERKNLLVSGGTGTGKTALLNALIAQIPETQRLVVIEDTRELRVEHPNRVIFEAHPAAGVTLRDLVRQALRFRPDRIIIGEVRGAEAFDLLQAMNTGHEGCLGTLHANSAEEALHRLVQLVLQAGMGWTEEAIARQVGRTIGGIIQLGRVEGRRRIDHIQRVEGYEHGRYQGYP